MSLFDSILSQVGGNLDVGSIASKFGIDPSMADDREMLEDLVAAAFNDAAHRVEAAISEKMGAMTAGLGLPAGFKLPF